MLGDISHVDYIYIRTGYTDMRKQLSGLLDIIQYNFKLDPYGNAVFLFLREKSRQDQSSSLLRRWFLTFV